METNTPSVPTTILRSAASAYEKSKRLPAENPRAIVAESGVPYKWKRARGWRRQAKEVVSNLGLSGFPRLPFPPPTTAPWVERNDDWEISLGLRDGSNRNDPPDRLLQDALATVRAYDPLDGVFYTDGSVEGGFGHGGSAMVETSGDPGQPHFLEERCLVGPRVCVVF